MMIPIDVSTTGIFTTQFYDKALQDITTLGYPESHCKLHHPPRDYGQGTVYKATERAGSVLTDWLQNNGLHKWGGRQETIYTACKGTCILNGTTNKKGEILGIGPKVRKLIEDHYPGSLSELYTSSVVCESGDSKAELSTFKLRAKLSEETLNRIDGTICECGFGVKEQLKLLENLKYQLQTSSLTLRVVLSASTRLIWYAFRRWRDQVKNRRGSCGAVPRQFSR